MIKMGIKEFFSRFVTQKVTDWKAGDYSNITALLIDANAILYEIPHTTEEDFIKEVIKTISHNVLEKIKPTDIFIFAFDGIPNKAKRDQQEVRRFISGRKRKQMADKSYDTLNFTVGMPMMMKLSLIVNKWIFDNKDILPKYTIFSGVGEMGEAEFKLFKKFEEVKQQIRIDYEYLPGRIYTVDDFFSSSKTMILGKDSDLSVLSLLRTDDNIIWLRDFYPHKFQSDAVDIRKLAEFIVGCMGGDPKNRAIHKDYLIDFTLLTYFIGDDFIHPMYTLTLSVGDTLMELMNIYQRFFIGRRLAPFGKLDTAMLDKFLNDGGIDLENRMYTLKFETNRLDVKIKYLIGTRQDSSIVRDSFTALKAHIGRSNPHQEFEPSEILEKTYDEFKDFWKKAVSCPSILFDKKMLPKSEKLMNFRRLLIQNSDNDFNDACYNYFVGLQWNLSYYLGVQVNDWYYKWNLSPLLIHLKEFLNRFGHIDIPFQLANHFDPIVNNSQHLLTIINSDFSGETLRYAFVKEYNGQGKKIEPKSIAAFQKQVERLTSNSRFYQCFFPGNFRTFDEGNFFDNRNEKHGGYTLLPKIPMREVFLIQNEANVSEYGNPHYREMSTTQRGISTIENRLRFTVVDNKSTTIESKDENDEIKRDAKINLRKRDIKDIKPKENKNVEMNEEMKKEESKNNAEKKEDGKEKKTEGKPKGEKKERSKDNKTRIPNKNKKQTEEIVFSGGKVVTKLTNPKQRETLFIF